MASACRRCKLASHAPLLLAQQWPTHADVTGMPLSFSFRHSATAQITNRLGPRYAQGAIADTARWLCEEGHAYQIDDSHFKSTDC